jgi:hypothetical protein
MLRVQGRVVDQEQPGREYEKGIWERLEKLERSKRNSLRYN